MRLRIKREGPPVRTRPGTPNRAWLIGFVLAVAWECFVPAGEAAPSWNAPPPAQTEGHFWRLHWYERGLTNGNPAYDARFRINAPEVVFHPVFGRRIEARENGLMLIRAEEDLFQLSGAELYLEMWGGHPGTANKRFTLNGRTTYSLPRVGTEQTNCTYFYPATSLKITDLVNGYNAFQFAVDQGTTFWGHALIDNACLRVCLTNRHPELESLGLAGFEATVSVLPGPEAESFKVQLLAPEAVRPRIAWVDFQGWYTGYDENGNGEMTDWHGFTKGRLAQFHLGKAERAPFETSWTTRMLPVQENASVRAIVHFVTETNVVYVTAASRGFGISKTGGHQVTIVKPADLPRPFWSRAGQKRFCTLNLEADPSEIDTAELHVILWDGGPGTVTNYFTLNGVPLAVAGTGRHDVLYRQIPIDPKVLKRGSNRIEVLSDTEHHGLEVLLPGPELIVRFH